MTTERGLLIGGEEVPASSGKPASDLDSTEPFTGLRWVTLQHGHRPFPF
jgi:hypothetical protein